VTFDLTDLDFLRHTNELLAGRGLREEFPYVYIGEGTADATTAKHLGVEIGSTIVLANRVRKVNGEPIGLFRSELANRSGLLEKLQEAQPASIRDFISKLCNVQIDHAVTEIRAVSASSELAPIIGVPDGHPVLEVQQIRYDGSNVPIYLTRSHWRTDLITFRLTRQFQA
jgi:GntR family transcriptional regulator